MNVDGLVYISMAMMLCIIYPEVNNQDVDALHISWLVILGFLSIYILKDYLLSYEDILYI